jgi:predicted DNA-binding WGR domain protein
MPRYEFSDGSSNKFWQIDLSGTSFTTTYGKIGTSGQKTVKTFGSNAEAKKEHDKLVAEKVKKGYELTDGDDDDDDDDDDEEDAPAPKKVAVPKAAAKSKGGGTSTPRYFEFSEGTSNKFWQIWIDGTCVLTKYGRIGTTGSTTQKEWGTDDKATKEYNKLVDEKTKKGYEEKDLPE